MQIRTSCLRDADVINICTGKRLGWICDFEIDTCSGRICTIFVSDKIFGFSGQKNIIRIPFDKIVCIGDDAILVDCGKEAEKCTDERCAEKKHGFLW